MTDIFNFNVNHFLRQAIGFHKAFSAFEYGGLGDNHAPFPHYNIKEKDFRTNIIEIALAGYDPSEIDVIQRDRYLTILGGAFLEKDKAIDPSGKEVDTYSISHSKSAAFKKEAQKEEDKNIYQGISKRSFRREFLLNDSCDVVSAKFRNGLLCITIVDKSKSEDEEKKIKIEVE